LAYYEYCKDENTKLRLFMTIILTTFRLSTAAFYAGKFFVANIVMVSLSLVVSVVVLNLWNRSKTRCVGPPSFCRTV